MTDQHQADVAISICSSFLASSSVLKLFESTSVQNAHEALVALLHTFMLKNGFRPKDVPDEEKYLCIPKNWNTSGLFKIFYTHSCCPEFSCCMTCIPLYKIIVVNGTICDIDCSDNVSFKVQTEEYLKQNPNFKNISEIFCNVDELYRNFMDSFHLPLLNLLHESHGIFPQYGLNALIDEMKMHILKCLPVQSVLAMSVVNKTFNVLANSPTLWKLLYQKDYGKDGVPDIEPSTSEMNWKEKYKREYLKRKPRTYIDRWPPLRPPGILPELVPYRPYFDGEFGYDFDPRFPFAPPFYTSSPYGSSLPQYLRRLI